MNEISPALVHTSPLQSAFNPETHTVLHHGGLETPHVGGSQLLIQGDTGRRNGFVKKEHGTKIVADRKTVSQRCVSPYDPVDGHTGQCVGIFADREDWFTTG